MESVPTPPTALMRRDRPRLIVATIASPCPKSVDPNDLTGCENIGPEDTLDADYGRLLEAAMTRKGWRARRESNPRPTGSKPVALSI